MLLMPLMALAPLPSSSSSSASGQADVPECAGCAAYACMERVAHCGPSGYLLAFGLPNCERFGEKDIYDRFDALGKQFINCTASCLIADMEQYIGDHRHAIDCVQLQSAAFHAHPGCYLQCGFCKMCRTNKWALFRGYRLRDFGSAMALRQVATVLGQCGGPFSCL